MKTVTVQKNVSQKEALLDSDQTIAEIRALRFELSKKIKTWEDVQKMEKEVDILLEKEGTKFRKFST